MKDRIVKLTNTVYNLLEYFPESDPLKIKVKEKALAIMENLSLILADEGWVSLKDCFSGSREKAKQQTLEDIEIAVNCFKLARMQRWISNISFLIVFNEYEKILRFCSGQVKKEIGGHIIIADYTQKYPELVAIEDKYPESQDSFLHSSLPKVMANHGEITARQRKILEFLEQNKKAQVMDLTAVLPNVTKRTIRRDLDELLKTGRVAREGEFNQVLYRIA